MPRVPLRSALLSDFQVRIILYAYPHLSQWSYDDLSAPYWRLYWNNTPGAWLCHNGKRFDLDPDFITLVPPDTACACGLAEPTDHFNVHFTIQSPYAASQPGILQWQASPESLDRIRAAGERIRSRETGRKLDIMVHHIIADALDAIPENGWPQKVMDHRIQTTVSAIDQNPGAPVSNTALAHRAGLSTGGFIRLFTESVGMPPRAYQLRARIAESCRLLVQTDLSMDAIAEECGFWDRNYFTRVFKRMNYVTPVAFRRQRRQG